MSPKRKPNAEVTPTKPARTSSKNEHLSAFEPRHGPNAADRADTVDKYAHLSAPGDRQPDSGDEGQEAEKAGGNN